MLLKLQSIACEVRGQTEELVHGDSVVTSTSVGIQERTVTLGTATFRTLSTQIMTLCKVQHCLVSISDSLTLGSRALELLTHNAKLKAISFPVRLCGMIA